MAHPLTLPTLSVLALVGTALGVQLGRSAVSEINPAYFGEPETRFHADLAPYRSETPPPLTLTDAEAAVALGSPCIGCTTASAEYYPIYEAGNARYATGTAAIEASQPVEAPTPVDLERQAEFAELGRYASYPVSHEEAAAAAAAEAAPEDQRLEPAVD